MIVIITVTVSSQQCQKGMYAHTCYLVQNLHLVVEMQALYRHGGACEASHITFIAQHTFIHELWY